MELKPGDIAFSPASYADPSGRLFTWQGGVYRAIAPERADFYRELLTAGRLAPLLGESLIRTEIAPLRLEGYGLVLRHSVVPWVSYPFEWTGEMLLDAARLTLELNGELGRQGLELKDANPWNVLFEGPRPVWVDFGSIQPITGPGWPAFSEFCKSFLNPLLLMANGLAARARQDLRNHRYWGTPDAQLLEALPFLPGLRQRLLRILNPIGAFAGRERQAHWLRQQLAEIRMPAQETFWSTYHDQTPDLSAPGSWSPKQRLIDSLLSQQAPKTVIDLGTNTGWYARLACRYGARVAAFDADERSLEKLYSSARQESCSILPLVMDFKAPTPAHGPSGEFPGALERFRAEMVLALALVHHLVFKAGMRFEQIAAQMASMSERTLCVEFVPKEDRYVQEWYSEAYAWYDLAGFRAALAGSFDTIEVCPSNREPRNILVCRKKAGC